VVLGYKQLSEIERVLRDMKHLIDIRPVRHRLPDRIRAHVLLCWLGMLLIRIAEQENGQTWFQTKKALATLQDFMAQQEDSQVIIEGRFNSDSSGTIVILSRSPA
jgi:transposase